jgi:hypothetical protein
MQLGSISANADGRSSSGEITQEGPRLSVTVDGVRVGPPVVSMRAAAERLAQAIGQKLPGNPSNWSVAAQCSTNGLSIVVSHPPRGGGGGSIHPCAARVLRNRPLPTLEAAVAAFAHVLGTCCT